MTLKIGIIGLGRIVKSSLEALKTSDKVVVSSVASRDSNKASDFALKYNIQNHFNTYQDLIKSSHVDAVYIPLPNSLHAEFCELALKHRKPVICEKPITTSVAEFERLIALSQKYKTPILEALMYQFNSPFFKIKRLIEANEIGKVKYVEAVFNYSSTKLLDHDIRLNKELGGGVVNDLLYYPVSFSNSIMGSIPREFEILDFHYEKVARTVTLICEYKNGVKAKIQSSFDYPDENFVYIEGSNGLIEMKNPFRYDPQPKIHIRTSTSREIIFQNQKHRYLAQFEHLEKIINAGASSVRSHGDALKDIQTIETINRMIKCNVG